MVFSIYFTVDLQADGMVNYAKRLSQVYSDRDKLCGRRDDLRNWTAQCGDFEWSGVDVFDADSIYFWFKSTLAPQAQDEWIANQMLRFTGISLSVFEQTYEDIWPQPKRSLEFILEQLRDGITFSYSALEIWKQRTDDVR
jgi:hypothetical protein